MTYDKNYLDGNRSNKAILLAKDRGAVWVEYDRGLFDVKRVYAMLGSQHAKGESALRYGPGGRQRELTIKATFPARGDIRAMPVDIVIYNELDAGFVQMSTDSEFADDPRYVSLVRHLCDRRSAVVLNDGALKALSHALFDETFKRAELYAGNGSGNSRTSITTAKTSQ
ncbi:MAG: hypothetical protein HYT71_00725 [Candidatus Aenigmarchaeota archaeon]|nr:hypothetical protein [Candidatus Aenigmarchaeota archaeon]